VYGAFERRDNVLHITPVYITATTLDDAWFQSLDALLHTGRRFTIDQGSYAGQTRVELDWYTCHITRPWARDPDSGRPRVPVMPEGSTIPPPVDPEYIDNYVSYLMTADAQPGEDYTYGERLWSTDICQIPMIIEIYRSRGHRNNQLVLQVAMPSDIDLDDPPCLRHIDTRVQDNKLHFYPYFRSWDLWGGYPANLAGISVLQEYMASEIGVEQGEMVVSSKGLHIYQYVEQLAMARTHVGG